jgi:hypothetical protein
MESWVALAIGFVATIGAVLATLGAGLRRRTIDESRHRVRRRSSTAERIALVSLGVSLIATIPVFLFAFRQAESGATEKSVTIDSPRPGDRVPQEITVSGQASNLSGDFLWILLRPASVDRFYPQTGPVRPQSNGTWTSPLIFLGSSEDAGEQFAIIAVVANAEANRNLERYLARGIETGNFPGLTSLPQGITPYSTVVVTRQ